MQLSIIIPTKDRGSVFDETLACAIKAVEHLDAEILVVNDSRERTPSIPDLSAVRMIDNPGKGVAAARNAGVKATTGNLLLFLDDDIVISRSSIDHVIAVHQQDSRVCLNPDWRYPPSLVEKIQSTQFGRFMIANRMVSFKGWYNDPTWKDNALFPSRSVASFHLSLKREHFERTGGYNEKFPHAGFEDYDFPLRLKEAGLSFYIDTRITVFHNEADRFNMDNWLGSQERRAGTRKVAVGLGYKELDLDYSPFKRFAFSLIGAGSGVVRAMMLVTPNHSFFDPLFFRLVSALQAQRIYRGYSTH